MGEKTVTENEIMPKLIKSINWVLKSFNEKGNDDLEGLCIKTSFLNEIAKNKLCEFDLDYKIPIDINVDAEIIKWQNEYLKKIKDKILYLRNGYIPILNTKMSVEKLFEFQDQGIKSYNEIEKKSQILSETISQELIFRDCIKCPKKFSCFCLFKTFIISVFDQNYIKICEKNKSLDNIIEELLSGKVPNSREKYDDLIEKWFTDNIVKYIGENGEKYIGYPYLIKKNVENEVAYLAQKNPDLDVSTLDDIDENGKYVNIDAYITISLVTLLKNSSFTSKYAININDDEIEDMIKTIKYLQVDQSTPKHYLHDTSSLRIKVTTEKGGWKEGFWGGRKIVRFKSTAEIANKLFEIDGLSDTVMKAVEFLLNGFPSQSEILGLRDHKSINYVLDDASFRHINLTCVTTIAGTVAILSFLVNLKANIERLDCTKISQEYLKRLEWLKSTKSDEFIDKRIKWILKEQHSNGTFPIISESFIKKMDHTKLVQEFMFSKPIGEVYNTSFSNTVDVVSLLIDYLKYIHKRKEEEIDYKLLISDFEKEIRIFIRDNLKQFYEDKSWFEDGIPSNLILKWANKFEKDKGRTWKKNEENKLFEFLEFPDYIEIISMENNWNNIFKDKFPGDKNLLKARLTEINDLINPLMQDEHVPEDKKIVAGVYIRNFLKLFEEAKNERKLIHKSSIFLCHSHEDKKFVRKLAVDLKKNGIKVWIDEAEILVGDNAIKKIGEGIKSSDYLGVVISEASVKSNWVQNELSIALTTEIAKNEDKVLPLLIGKIEDSSIPTELIHKLYADFRKEEDYNSSLKKILKRCKSSSKE
ncbi:MAG: toll/interleukin-1 receptor domain-containing protein [Spirochaetes bacterium]|nr:toll/interleukin-1 receptor domain-containing protein [Spirochaetota bacterium]